MEPFDRESFWLWLAVFIEGNELTIRQVAKAIGCSEATLTRVLADETLPTRELMEQGGIMFELGFDRYRRLSDSQRSRIAEELGAAGGGALGFAAIPAAIEAAGIAGVSAVGISSGLAALGGTVGGGMVAGVAVAAAIPLAAGAVGYGVIVGAKHVVEEARLNDTAIDLRWEAREIRWKDMYGDDELEVAEDYAERHAVIETEPSQVPEQPPSRIRSAVRNVRLSLGRLVQRGSKGPSRT